MKTTKHLYRVWGTLTGKVLVGEYEAESAQDALAQGRPDAVPPVCSRCRSDMEDLEVGHLSAERVG